jgi:hypothetical protein
MTSAVTICSNALMRLGAKPISSFTESDSSETNTPLNRVQLCANLYPVERLAFLREHTWQATISRVILSPDVTTPAFEWSYRFLRPSDWLKTVQIGQNENNVPPFRIEGNYFMGNDAVFYLVYCRDIPEEQWDTLMVDAMTVRMMAVLADPITRDPVRVNAYTQLATQRLQVAKSMDGQDDATNTIGQSILATSRFGGFTRGR